VVSPGYGWLEETKKRKGFIMDTIEKLKESKDSIFKKTKEVPEIGLILGSGLGGMADSIQNPVRIPYSDIPHFVRSTVEGHRGELVLGKLFNKNVLIMQGRLHFYEGYTMQDVTYPVRLMSFMGIKTLVLTSAVGGINTNYKAGDIVFIKDHINLMGDNPLRGPHEEQFGERFPDMTGVYTVDVIKRAMEIAGTQGVTAHTGVYVAVRGPSYETPLEIEAFRKLGADVVGMSVVPEAIVAHQQGMKLLCAAYVSNMAAGVSPTILSHKEVMEMGNKVAGKLIKLLEEVVKKI